ncbi:hypothetical protein [Clostridium sardiniense]
MLIVAFFAIKFILNLSGYKENTNILSFLGGIVTSKLASKISFNTLKLNNYRESIKNRPILDFSSIDAIKLKEGNLSFTFKNKTSNVAKDINIDLKFYGNFKEIDSSYKLSDRFNKDIVAFDNKFIVAISGNEEVGIDFDGNIDKIYEKSSVKEKVILISIKYSDIFDNVIKQVYAIGIDSENSEYKIIFLENEYLLNRMFIN